MGAVENQTKNEPVASQVVDGSGGNNAPGTRPTAPVASVEDSLETIIEKYNREIDQLREYDHLE